jgi:hypothetical protein
MRSARPSVSILATVALLVWGWAARCDASAPPEDNRIELRYYTPSVEVLTPQDFARPTSFEDVSDGIVGVPEHQPLDLRMPEVGPECLDLTVRFYRLELSVSADLGASDHPFTPRVDGNANDTYWWMRASFDVTDELTVFLESFQGANSIVSSSKYPPPKTAWDGFQFEIGLRGHLGEQWTFEAGPVIYAMSASRRPDELGCRLSLTCQF